jgi:anti-sigma-K factor RskA
MIDDRQEELAALAALDLLEGEELADFQAALARDPELRRRACECCEAAAALCHMAPAAEVPAGLKARILQSVPQAGRPPERAARIIPFAALLPWAIAACLAAAAAWSGARYLAVRSENLLMRNEQKLAGLELQRVRNQMEEERIVDQRELADSRGQLASLSGQLKVANNLMRLKIVALTSAPGGAAKGVAVVLWDAAKQEGMLDVSKLPALAAGKDYQLWALDPQYGAPVNSGVFQVDPVTCTACITFKTEKPINSGSRFAVSLERKGGVPSPEGPVVLVSD